MLASTWFDSWDSLLKIFVSSLAGYAILILYLKVAGKRATSKMNNFDWIVTVAIGSMLASMIVSKDVTVSGGALAMASLVGLQYVLTTATSRWEGARKFFLAAPSLLYLRGNFDEREMRKQRICYEEIVSAVRESGLGSWQDVYAVTLEPDAELSVVKCNAGETMEIVQSMQSDP